MEKQKKKTYHHFLRYLPKYPFQLYLTQILKIKFWSEVFEENELKKFVTLWDTRFQHMEVMEFD